MKRSLQAVLFVLALASPLYAQGVRYVDQVFPATDARPDRVFSQVNDSTGKPLAMDFYFPRGDTATDRCFIGIFHGGYCRVGTRKDPGMLAWADDYARRGYVTASIEYRLSATSGACKDGQSDGFAAMRYVRAHAAELGVNPACMFSAGFSNGSSLALSMATNYEMVGTADDTNPSNPGPESRTYGAVLAGHAFAASKGWLKAGDPPLDFYSGAQDEYLPLATLVYEQAQALKIVSRMKTYPGVGHNVFVAGLRPDIAKLSSRYLYDNAIPKPPSPPPTPTPSPPPTPVPVLDRMCVAEVVFEGGEQGFAAVVSTDGRRATFRAPGQVRRWKIKAPEGKAFDVRWDSATWTYSTTLSDCTPGGPPTPPPPTGPPSSPPPTGPPSSPPPTTQPSSPPPPTPSPGAVITDVVVERLDYMHAVIAWASGSTKLSSWVEFGELGMFRNLIGLDAPLTDKTREWSTRRATLHRALLTSLKPGASYTYRACGKDDQGVQTCSGTGTFTTPAEHKPWPWVAAAPPWDPWAQPAGPVTHTVDNRGTCGQAGQPLCKIPTQLPAGSVVDVYGDHDFNGGAYKVVAEGTAAAPVFIRAKGGAMLRNINPHFLVRGSFVYVDNFVVEQGGFRIGFDINDQNQPVLANGVVFRWTEVRDSWWNGIDTWGLNGGVLWSYLHHNQRQKKADPFDSDQMGVIVARGDGMWLVGDVAAYNGGDGFHANGRRDQGPAPRHIYIADILCDGDRENCTDLKAADDVVIGQSECIEHRGMVGNAEWCYRDGSACFVIKPTNLSDGSCGTVGSEGPTQNVTYIANNFHHSGNGIRIEECLGKVSIALNVFHDLNWGNVSTQQPTCAVDVVSNTILGGQDGIRGPAVSVTWRVLNNLVANVSSADSNKGYAVIVDRPAAGSELRSLLGFPAPKVRWNGPPGSRSGDVVAAPLFVDEANRNLRLQAGSPAKDAGFDLTAFYAALAQQLGYSVQRDADGQPVPVGPWDIGAYEVRP